MHCFCSSEMEPSKLQKQLQLSIMNRKPINNHLDITAGCKSPKRSSHHYKDPTQVDRPMKRSVLGNISQNSWCSSLKQLFRVNKTAECASVMIYLHFLRQQKLPSITSYFNHKKNRNKSQIWFDFTGSSVKPGQLTFFSFLTRVKGIKTLTSGSFYKDKNQTLALKQSS